MCAAWGAPTGFRTGMRACEFHRIWPMWGAHLPQSPEPHAVVQSLVPSTVRGALSFEKRPAKNPIVEAYTRGGTGFWRRRYLAPGVSPESFTTVQVGCSPTELCNILGQGVSLRGQTRVALGALQKISRGSPHGALHDFGGSPFGDLHQFGPGVAHRKLQNFISGVAPRNSANS